MSGSHRQVQQRSRFGIFAVALTIVALLAAVVVALFSGGSDGSHHHSAHRSGASTSVSHSRSTSPSSHSSPSSTSGTTKDVRTKSNRKSNPTLIYIVRPGNCLSVISDWFHAHGYQSLYKWNKKVVGKNPNLIRPGQKLIVRPGSSMEKVVNAP